jgi:hypothetical protein
MIDMTAIALRRDIRAAVASGRTLSAIEQDILGNVPLPADSRDALWLYAWSLTWHRDRGRPRHG